jgi:iron complex outermembrane recepter protein
MMKNKKALVMSVLCAIASVGFVMSASAAEQTMHGNLDEVVVEGSADVLPGGMVSKTGSVGIIGDKDVMDVPFQQVNVAEEAVERFGADE